MARIDLPEPYAIRFARQAINDSLMSHGEECVLLHMYHVNEDEGTQPRCPVCYDDIYKQGERYDCNRCYGTTFDGGVKEAYRTWGIFTDADDVETFSRRGLWHPVARSLHTEPFPDLWQRDYVVRVPKWTIDHRIAEIDRIYVFKQVQNDTVRTGNKFGQTDFDVVSQRADLQEISTDMPIHEYPLVGERFDRWDGAIR